ncbi:MAG: hypothetical protein WB715_11000 [Roseiarcus sp.]|uniref:hypothetical protein n=1 Tax=Roseiarcus sp. TaxID=1969460 RepID=UPI003C4D86EE
MQAGLDLDLYLSRIGYDGWVRLPGDRGHARPFTAGMAVKMNVMVSPHQASEEES